MLPLRNIFRRKIRTLITILGVAIGISLFTTAISFSQGFQKQIQEIIKNYQVDITVQSKGSPTPIHSRITWSDYQKLKNIEEIENISSMIIGTIRTKWNPYFMVLGVSNDILNYRIGLLKGRKMYPDKKEAIIGQVAAEMFGYDINSQVELGEDEIYTITGIYSTSIRIIDGALCLNYEDIRRMLRFNDYANMLFIRLKENADPATVIQKINKNYPELSAAKSSDFTGQMRLNKTIKAFVWAITIISLFTSIIIVSNTLVMSITERIREIGILMAIGWSRFMIIKMIIHEAIIICFIGGITGNIIAIIQLWMLNHINTIGPGWVPVSVSYEIFIKSIVFSLIIGILSAISPAAIASKLLPAEALRYE